MTTSIHSQAVPSNSVVTPPASRVAPAPTRWAVDTAHAQATFKVRHLLVAWVRGTLGPVSGTVVLDETSLARSRAEIRIDARELTTGNPQRDEHLRSADFLDVAAHPFVSFETTHVADEGGGLRLTGQLTVRGVTRPITFEVELSPDPIVDPWGRTKRGASARGSLSRKEWGLTWNLAMEAGGLAVGDEVSFDIDLELIKEADAASGPA